MGDIGSDFKIPHAYRIYRNEEGKAKADLLCQQCGEYFTVDADDSVFVALIIGVSPRYNCGRHNATEEQR